MKYFKIVISLLLVSIYSTAQNDVYFIPSDKQIDRVRWAMAHRPNDTVKMSSYFYLSSYYTELNKDTALYFADLQLQLAKKLQQPLWAADACFQSAYSSYSLGNYPKAFNAIAEGLAITDDPASEKNNWRIETFSGDGDSHKARLFIAAALHQQFAFLYSSTDNIPKAIEHFNVAIQLAKSVDNKAELSLDYMVLSGIYAQMGKPDSALTIQNLAQRYAIESNYKIYMGYILRETGDLYLARNQYDSAGTYFFDNLDLLTQLGLYP